MSIKDLRFFLKSLILHKFIHKVVIFFRKIIMFPPPEILYKIQQDSFSFESIRTEITSYIERIDSEIRNLQRKWIVTALSKEVRAFEFMKLKDQFDILAQYPMKMSKIKMGGIDFEYITLNDKSGKVIDVLMYGIDYKNNCLKYTSLFHIESQQNDSRS